ncbi:MAG: hypothetical protein L3K01_05525 [Thermoplasmata archaeon]|nr:hypothetical protein [Thermoplasmata archaeon]
MVVGTLGILLVASLSASPSGAGARGIPGALSSALRPSGSSLCTTLTTNASLEGRVAAHYPNASLEPSEATANASVSQIWATICTSLTLLDAEDQSSNVSFASSVFIGDSNGSGGFVTSGSLFVQISVAWTAACPTGSTRYPTGYPCDFSDRWTGNLTTAAIAGPVVEILSERYAGCTVLATNASLVVAVDGLYPDPALHPTEAVAAQVVQVVWGDVCSSLAFYQAYAAHPGISLGLQWGGGPGPNESSLGNQTLSVYFVFEWAASCPSGSPNYPAGSDCAFDEVWSANLASGNWTGPVTTVRPETSSGWGPGGIPDSSITGFPANLLLVLGLVVAVAAAAVSMAWSRIERRRPPPGGSGNATAVRSALPAAGEGRSGNPEGSRVPRTGRGTQRDSSP